MITIIDYGLGNLRSLLGALEKISVPCRVSSDLDEISSSAKLILPGVGAFGDGIKNLKERHQFELLNQLVLEKKIPILGICLGAQLLAELSYEFGEHTGFGWIDAKVRLLKPNGELRVPHVGWNELTQTKDSVLFRDIPDQALFYFVHSFHIDCTSLTDVTGRCDYGGSFVAAFERANIFGVQFHPEKSQQHGLTLLRNFALYAQYA